MADAVTVTPAHRVVVAEGLFVLVGEPPWSSVQPLLDLSIYLHVPRALSKSRASRRKAATGGVSRLRLITAVLC